jgi:hypothetical protein
LGWGLERSNCHLHPVVERETDEQIVQLALAFGTVKAEDPGPVGLDGQFPESVQVALLCQFSCCRSFGTFSSLEIRLSSALRNLQIELNEKLHGFILS